MKYSLFKEIYDTKNIIGEGGTGIVKEWCLNNCSTTKCNDCSKSVIKVIYHTLVDIQLMIKIFRIGQEYNLFPKLFKCYKHDDTYYIIMERVNDCFKREKVDIDLLIKNSISKLYTMHKLNICHKDLDRRNIMIINNDIIFIDVDSCSFIKSDSDIIHDIKTLCMSILFKLRETNSIPKFSRSISKVYNYDRNIIALCKKYIKEFYRDDIAFQAIKELP